MNKNGAQVVNTLLIVLGGGLLIYLMAREEKENVYLLIFGIIMLMFGLYRATNHWVYTKDDPSDDELERNKNEK